jgi:hypothetical protein
MIRGPARAVALLCVVGACLWACSVAGAFVYWQGSDGVEAANLDGSNAQPLSGTITGSDAAASDGSHLYFGGRPDSSGTTRIVRVGVDGSGLNTSFVTMPNATCTALHLSPSSDALALDGAHIYWADSILGTVGRANLADGSSPDPEFIDAAGGACGAATSTSGPDGVAVDSSHVYWTNPDQNTIGRANLDGSSPNQSFITGAHHPAAIVVTGSNVYWANNPTDGSGGTIGHAQLDATGAVIPASVNESFITGVQTFGPSELATAGGFLLFDNGDGWIGRVSPDGTGLVHHLVQSGLTSQIEGLAADGLHSDPTSSDISCAPAALQIADPLSAYRGVFAHYKDMATCTFTVRDTGTSPTPPTGLFTVGTSPDEFDYELPSHREMPVPDTCQLKSTAAGTSSCAFLTLTDSRDPGYVPNATVALAGTYAGDEFHDADTAKASILTTTVYGCDFAGDGYKEVCDKSGFVLGGGPRGKGGHTTSTSFKLGGGHVTLTVPRDCLAPDASFVVKFSFRGHISVRSVQVRILHKRVTDKRAPYVVHITNPSTKDGGRVTVIERVTIGPKHGRHTTKRYDFSRYVC